MAQSILIKFNKEKEMKSKNEKITYVVYLFNVSSMPNWM